MKSIFHSKTFWVNALALAAHSATELPPEYAVPVVAIVNILLRLLTEEPVSILRR